MKMRPAFPVVSARRVEELQAEYDWLDQMALKYPGGVEAFWSRHRKRVEQAFEEKRLRHLRIDGYQRDL